MILSEIQALEHGIVVVYHLPVASLPEFRDEVQTFFGELNAKLVHGVWAQGRDNGRLFFRASIPTANGQPTTDVVSDLIMSTIMMADHGTAITARRSRRALP